MNSVRNAVIDSSPLINLVHLELAGKLSQYFQVVYVPRRVQVEVNRRSRFRYRLNKLYRTGLFQRCFVADEASVQLLSGPSQRELHEAEAEALVQAQEQGVAVFIGDEKPAREIGERMGIKPVGTIRILARLNIEGLASDPHDLVDKLRRDLAYRITTNVVQQAIARADEPI
jgi:predicted nucleic acid-binding protein